MINRSFYLIHEQSRKKEKHDKIIHTHTYAHRLRKKEIGNHISLLVDRKLCFYQKSVRKNRN